MSARIAHRQLLDHEPRGCDSSLVMRANSMATSDMVERGCGRMISPREHIASCPLRPPATRSSRARPRVRA